MCSSFPACSSPINRKVTHRMKVSAPFEGDRGISAEPKRLALRVVQVLSEDNFGGPHQRIITLARELMATDIEITLCLPEGSGSADIAASRVGVASYRLKMSKPPHPNDFREIINWIIRLPRDILNFRRLFRRLKVDIVHVNGGYFIAPAIAARLVKKPLAWHLNDTILPKSIAVIFGLIVQVLANEVIAQGRSVAYHYGIRIRNYKKIYPPVDVLNFTPAPSAVLCKYRKGYIRLGLIANWNRIKGIEYFLEAAAILRERYDQCVTLVFAGARLPRQTKYCARIDQMIEELNLGNAVEHHGFIDDCSALLRTIDVLIMSSKSEGCPIVVLQAMATGVPVVATDVGSVSEVLLHEPDDPAGIVVTSQRADLIAEAVNKLLLDRLRKN